ncbi:MAG: Uncharacterized protein Greene071421_112 [Parcubacteria group bacterium Greene0714_21]|nr:MAG: Uncharacterized protein Greene041639_239 [Parcubacteria group bacterium Greene0416_39]TSC98514.1 MAG: Uncharacterized protein Greene101447_16 [Parcubacteria group bacterium Greene1014_47]TSD04276.1 MAG: Uncharacterized protein Greene071421_112 [Parcubacteria group bacterium Greene0714_21]
MIIELNKFGTTLVSRQAGREAWAAFQPTLRTITSQENIEVSFDGVLTFSPSWADEFITTLKKQFGDRVILSASDNPSVKATLDILGI